MVGNYAIKSIALVDFMDVRDIAIPVPFLGQTGTTLNSSIFNRL
jgi:hypothetical protein